MNFKRGLHIFSKVLILFLSEVVIFSSVNVSINRLNHWVIYIFVLSFQFSSITFLDIIDEVKINVLVSFEALMGERSPNRNTEGDLEILKSRSISSLHITSDQNLFMYVQFQKEWI